MDSELELCSQCNSMFEVTYHQEEFPLCGNCAEAQALWELANENAAFPIPADSSPEEPKKSPLKPMLSELTDKLKEGSKDKPKEPLKKKSSSTFYLVTDLPATEPSATPTKQKVTSPTSPRSPQPLSLQPLPPPLRPPIPPPRKPLIPHSASPPPPTTTITTTTTTTTTATTTITTTMTGNVETTETMGDAKQRPPIPPAYMPKIPARNKRESQKSLEEITRNFIVQSMKTSEEEFTLPKLNFSFAEGESPKVVKKSTSPTPKERAEKATAAATTPSKREELQPRTVVDSIWIEKMLDEIESKCNTKIKVVTTAHTFQAQNPDELSFGVSQEIKIIRKQRGGWWVGEIRGVIGWFPCNFTKEIQGNPDDYIEGEEISSDEEEETCDGLTVRALYNFEGEAEEELNLVEGLVYRVYEQNGNGWWKGVSLLGKCGWFPSSYVEPVSVESQNRHRAQTIIEDEAVRLQEINVIDFERKYDPKKYYVYTLQVVWNTGIKIARVRYSKLRDLHDQLVASHPDVVFPPFPDKIFFGRSHIQQVTQVRVLALNAFFNELVSMPDPISQSPLIHQFLCPPP